MSREHGAYALAGEDERSRDPVPGDLMTGCSYSATFVFLMPDGTNARGQDEVRIRPSEPYLYLCPVVRSVNPSGKYGLFLTPHGVYVSAMQMVRKL